MISYEPLWRTMKERNVTTYALINKHNFSPYTITNLKRNKSITMNTLEKLCRILHCTADSVVEFLDENIIEKNDEDFKPKSGIVNRCAKDKKGVDTHRGKSRANLSHKFMATGF